MEQRRCLPPLLTVEKTGLFCFSTAEAFHLSPGWFGRRCTREKAIRMDGNDKGAQTPDCEIVQPHITSAYVEKGWIGIGAAIDWIAMRGKPLTLELYRQREDEAAEALVTTLADMLPDEAQKYVRGVDESSQGPSTSIPSGIWPQTATSDSNDSGKPYRLIGVDEFDEWGGAILGPQVSGYHKVEVHTNFIRKHWPEDGEKTAAPSARNAVSQAQLRRLIGMICRDTSNELAPLTQAELIELVKRRFPNVPRDTVRRIYKELLPNQKPGPRGPRNPDRQRQIEEFGENLIAAQLHN